MILLVLEGYVEPHGKDFTMCDLCARWLGVVFLSCFAGLVQQKLWQLTAAAQEFAGPERSDGKGARRAMRHMGRRCTSTPVGTQVAPQLGI